MGRLMMRLDDEVGIVGRGLVVDRLGLGRRIGMIWRRLMQRVGNRLEMT